MGVQSTLGVPALGLPGAYARGEAVALERRSHRANRLFEEISEVEEALLERCHQLLDQAKTIRDLTTTPGGPTA